MIYSDIQCVSIVNFAHQPCIEKCWIILDVYKSIEIVYNTFKSCWLIQHKANENKYEEKLL